MVLIVIALGLLAKDYLFLRNAVQVQATIGTKIVGPEEDGVAVRFYTYEYNGKPYSKQGRFETDIGEGGQHVIAYINPDDPTEALIDSFWERWLLIILSGGLGLVLWGMGNQKGSIKGHVATRDSD
jgi:hypothetical protein